ncbi:hypothetical protein ABK040_009574 [Willaertia magna]
MFSEPATDDLMQSSDDNYFQGMEKLRSTYFSNLLQDNITHLDHAASTVYSNTCLRKVFEKVFEKNTKIYTNPHSDGSFSSKQTNQEIENIRTFLLKEIFNTDQREYDIVFTFNTTHSIKLVTECFPIDNDKSMVGYLSPFSHNSLIGGLRSCCKNIKTWKDTEEMKIELSNLFSNNTENNENNCQHLIGLTAECNSTGTKQNLDIIPYLTKNYKNIVTLLDIAKYSSTNTPIDLSKIKPDFLVFSFYKWFGYPTGLGALLINKRRISKIDFKFRNSYFGGGNVLINTSESPYYMKYRKENYHDMLENGTIPFISIIEMYYYLLEIKEMFNSVLNYNEQQLNLRDIFTIISKHTNYLQNYMIKKMKELKHLNNGKELVKIYNEHLIGNTSIINFNLFQQDGKMIGYSQVQQIASLNGFNIRTGCFCVPGSCQTLFQISSDEMIDNYERGGKVCWDDSMDIIPGTDKPTGSIRISFGYCSIKQDVDKFIDLLNNFFVTIIEKETIQEKQQEEDEQQLEENYKKDGIEDLLKTKYNVESDDIQLTHFYIYPIKSCAPMRIFNNQNNSLTIDKWNLESDVGAAYDREWAIIDEQNNVLNLKKCFKLAWIEPFVNIKERKLIISLLEEKTTDKKKIIEISLDEYPSEVLDDTTVCGRHYNAHVYPNEVNEVLSEFIGRNVKLIRRKKLNGVASFSNEGLKGQYLIITMESLMDLSERLRNNKDNNNTTIDECDYSVEVLIERFRPNIVIRGLKKAYKEDDIKSIYINGIPFLMNGPCGRCNMICINPKTLTSEQEPLKTLYTFRRDQVNKVLFGMLAQHYLPTHMKNQTICIYFDKKH